MRQSGPFFSALVLLLCALPATSSATLPDTVSCVVQPYYRFRPDGATGREVLVIFRGRKLEGPATVEVTSDSGRENLKIAPRKGGIDTLAIILPPRVGVSKNSMLGITIRQGTDSVRRIVAVTAMRRWTVYVYPHSHVDIGYSNTQANVEFIHKRNIDKGMAIAAATRTAPPGARYLWNTEVMWPYERYMASASPERQRVLAAAVRRGEICLDAAYVNILTTSCSDEEMLQNLRPRREAAQLTGQPIDTYVQVDIPGMSWGMVPVLAHEGVRYVMMMPNGGRGNDPMVSQFRYKPFWWVGPDNTSRVLFLNAGGYGAGMDKGGKTGRPWFGQRDRDKIPEAVVTGNPRADFLDKHLFRELPRREAQGYPYDLFVVTWAMWDNALQDAELPEAVRSWNAEYAFPHLVIAGAHEIMQTFERKYGDRFPVVRGDFTDYWTDTFGTAARQTRMNRNAKERLVQAETLWPMIRPGGPGPRADLDEAWRFVVLGTEHTFCTENPEEPYFQDAIWKVKQRYFQEADERSQQLLDEALAPATDKSNGALGPAMGPSNGGVAVFNTHSWPHGGVVTLSRAESRPGDRVVDDQGNEVLSQRLSTGDLLFLSPPVPAFGSRHFRVVAGTCSMNGTGRFTDSSLTNGQIALSIDRRTGAIICLSAMGRNFADRKAGLNTFHWQPARGAGDARPDTVESIGLAEAGPLLGEIRIVSRAPGCRSVTRMVRLVNTQPWVEISDVVDKTPLLPKDGVHLGFAFDLPGARIVAEIPWGTMRVNEDQWPAANRAWLTMQRFVDLSNDSLGITWCSPDAPLFESGSITANNTAGWDGKGDVWPASLAPGSTVYSWVMNNHWFTNAPLTQDGPVTFRYGMLPHGPYDQARAYRFGVEHSQPLIALAVDRDPAIRPPIGISGDRIAATILKPSADGKSMIVRLRSLSDHNETVALSWPALRPKSVRVCDRGEVPGPTDASSSTIVPARGFTTLWVEWR